MSCNHTILLPEPYRIRFYLHRLDFSDPATGRCTENDVLHFRDLASQSSQARVTCRRRSASPSHDPDHDHDHDDDHDDDAPRGVVEAGDLVFESSGSRVELLFASDHVFQGRGFELFYVGVASCRNETYDASSGSATSVNFPRPYPNMQECFYTVRVTADALDDDDNDDDEDDDDGGGGGGGLQSPREGQGEAGEVGGDVVIEVTFQEFFTESGWPGDARLRDELCSRDFVEIVAGSDRHKLCGDWSGKEHLLYFRFRSSSVVFR